MGARSSSSAVAGRDHIQASHQKAARSCRFSPIEKGALLLGVEEAVGIQASVKFAIYFNILVIIVITESVEWFSNSPSEEGPEALGVGAIVEWDYIKEGPSAEGETEEFCKHFVERYLNLHEGTDQEKKTLDTMSPPRTRPVHLPSPDSQYEQRIW